MKRGLILINAYSKMASSINQSSRLKDEFAYLGVDIDIKNNNYFASTIRNSEIVSNCSKYDFCIYLDKDKYISEMLESSGLRLFNTHRAILDCDDKMCTYIKLAGHDLPIVDTMPGLLCYTPDEKISDVTVDRIEEHFGYPVIVKECYGSLGKGVYKCDNREELIDIMNKLKMIPHLFQRFVSTSEGKDIRVIVIGGKCVTAMVRSSDSDFRSNIELGGKGTPIEITDEIRRISEGATRVLGLDYAGIDLLFDGDHLSICEVNSNAFFGGIEAVTHVNVAKSYAEYIVEEVYLKHDMNILKENESRVSITNLAYERCAKKLNTCMSIADIIALCKSMIIDARSKIYLHGKNWYVERDDIRFTINSSTYMIITADRI